MSDWLKKARRGRRLYRSSPRSASYSDTLTDSAGLWFLPSALPGTQEMDLDAAAGAVRERPQMAPWF